MSSENITIIALIIGLLAALFGASRPKSLKQPGHSELQIEVNTLKRQVAALQELLTDKYEELKIALEKLDGAMERIAILEAAQPQSPKVLLAVISDDSDLAIDAAILRKVQQRTGMLMTQIPPSMSRLRAYLNRHRLLGHPVENVHFSVHSGPGGLIIGGELATGAWLSESLKGTRLVLIAGCESDSIGDWIGIVPSVVTIMNKVTNSDAAIFTEAFWMAIGEGVLPHAAYIRALERSPSTISEYVEFHS